MARVHRTEYRREVSCKKRELLRLTKGPLQVFSRVLISTCKLGNYQVLPKRIRDKGAHTHARLGTVIVLTNQTGKLHDSQEIE